MPFPKALKKSAPKGDKKKRMAADMHDLKHGPHHKDRTHKQEVAIGLKNSGASKFKGPKNKAPGSAAASAVPNPFPPKGKKKKK